MRTMILSLLLGFVATLAIAEELDDAKQQYRRERREAAKHLYDSYKEAIAELKAKGSNERAETLQKEMDAFVASELNAVVGPIEPAIPQPLKGAALEKKPKGKHASTAPVRTNSKGNLSQKYTEFGQVKLTDDEIKKFIANCREQKPALLRIVQADLGRRAEKMTPSEINEAKALFNFLSQDKVLIAPRSANDPLFKAIGGGEQLTRDFGTATTLEVIDKNSAYASLENVGDRVIIEGIDTRKIPTGTWNSHLLLKVGGTKQVPGIVGNYEVKLFQAVSSEGFPKDVIIW